MNTTVITVARVNQVDIQIISNGEKRVAVKPICEALNIDSKTQIDRLKVDPILSSVVGFSPSTGSDGKQYEMVTIPLKYVFGWLFRIDSRNVKEEAREAVRAYQLQCYDALYSYFTRHDEFLEYRQQLIDEKLAVYDSARLDFRDAKDKVVDAREQLNEARALTEEQYFLMKAQPELPFDKEVSHE